MEGLVMAKTVPGSVKQIQVMDSPVHHAHCPFKLPKAQLRMRSSNTDCGSSSDEHT